MHTHRYRNISFRWPIWIDLQNGIQNCCASVNLTLGAKRQKTFFFFLCCFVLLQKLTWEKRKIILNIFVGMGECLVHPLMYTYHIYSPKTKENHILKSRFWSYKLWLIILLVFGNWIHLWNVTWNDVGFLSPIMNLTSTYSPVEVV